MWAVVITLMWGSFSVGGFESPDACVTRLNAEIRFFVRTQQTIVSAGCEAYGKNARPLPAP